MAFVYDFKKVNVIVDGEMLVDYADGDDVIQIVRLADDFNSRAGIKGKTSFSKTNDKRAEITIKLMSTSASYPKLKSLRGAQFDISIVDSNDEGNIKESATNCVIKRMPDITKGAGVTTMDWVFIAPEME